MPRSPKSHTIQATRSKPILLPRICPRSNLNTSSSVKIRHHDLKVFKTMRINGSESNIIWDDLHTESDSVTLCSAWLTQFPVYVSTPCQLDATGTDMHVWDANPICICGRHIWCEYRKSISDIQIRTACGICLPEMHVRHAYQISKFDMHDGYADLRCTSHMHIRYANPICMPDMHIRDAYLSDMHSP